MNKIEIRAHNEGGVIVHRVSHTKVLNCFISDSEILHDDQDCFGQRMTLDMLGNDMVFHQYVSLYAF